MDKSKNMDIHNNSYGRIPQVIEDFISGSGGRSIMLRGTPGTGKTTFALELLDKMKGVQRVLYISARVDEPSLKSHIPWLDFDIVMSKADHKHAGAQEDVGFGALKRTELDKLENRIELGDEMLEEPYDRETGTGKFEDNTLTFELPSILPELDRIYEAAEMALPDKALVVIDSIEALSEKYGIASTRLIHALQKDLVENSQMNVLFVMERERSSDQDYLGDGVISLEITEFEGRILRLMRIEKLRGFPIYSPQIPFTLDNGHFSCFEGMGEYIGMGSGSNGNRGGNTVTLGNIELGGLLSNILDNGTYNLIEIDPEVPVSVVRLISYSILRESLSKARGTYAFSSFRLFGNELDNSLRTGSHASIADDALRILTPIPLANREEPAAHSKMVDGEVLSEDLRWETIHALFPGSTSPLTFLVDINIILSQYGLDELTELETHLSALLENNGTCVGFSWPSGTTMRADFGFCNSLIRVGQIGRNTVIYRNKPHTPLFFLRKGDGKVDKEEHDVKLQIMV